MDLDEELSVEQKKLWVKILTEMVEQGEIRIARSCKPEDTDQLMKAILICYIDMSDVAKEFDAYLHYLLKPKNVHEALLTREDKLRTVGGQSTLRYKLDGNNRGSRGDSVTQSLEASATPL